MLQTVAKKNEVLDLLMSSFFLNSKVSHYIYKITSEIISIKDG